jgi:hypothetical protein
MFLTISLYRTNKEVNNIEDAIVKKTIVNYFDGDDLTWFENRITNVGYYKYDFIEIQKVYKVEYTILKDIIETIEKETSYKLLEIKVYEDQIDYFADEEDSILELDSLIEICKKEQKKELDNRLDKILNAITIAKSNLELNGLKEDKLNLENLYKTLENYYQKIIKDTK